MPTKQEIELFAMPDLPAEYKEFLENESNVKPRETMPTLNPGGKRWTIVIDGESVVLKKPDPENDGEKIPISIFKGFVVAHSEKRGRTYYESGFDEKKPGRPTCWSEDSVKPDDRVPATDKQHKVCNGCPMSAKGSAVADDGRETKACKEHQLMAIIPSQRVMTEDFPPLRLKLSITSIYDGKDQSHDEQGWYAWGPYLNHLTQIMPQSCHTARVETLIKFDPTVNYPKLLFKAKRPVTREEYIALVDLMRSKKELLATMVSALMPQGAALPPKAGAAEEDEDEPAPKKEKAKPTPTRKAAAADEEDDPSPKIKPKPTTADDDPPPKKKPKPAADEEDDPVPEGMKKKPKPAEDEEDPPKKAEAAATETKTKAKGNVKDLLQEWS